LDLPDRYEAFYESFPTHTTARQVNVEEIVQARQQGRKIHFVDARATAEQEVSVIPGAIRVSIEKDALQVTTDDIRPLLTDPAVATQLASIRDEDLVVAYCTAGLRGGFCAIALEEQLGRPCFNLTGGMIEWKNQGQEVQHDGQGTEAVHPCLPPLERYLRKP
jgi:rhodanese-related sulfurtransferase